MVSAQPITANSTPNTSTSAALYLLAGATDKWTAEIANILPLLALIHFLDILTKLHVFKLAGAAPLWSQTVTPARSRLLLPEDTNQFQAEHENNCGPVIEDETTRTNWSYEDDIPWNDTQPKEH